MAYNVFLDPATENDLKRLLTNSELRARFFRTIRHKLGTAPQLYGQRLRHSKSGFWKLRMGKIRVIYLIRGRDVTIYEVGLRDKVYEKIRRRFPEL